MEKYNNFLRNITELIEKGLFTSKELQKEVQNAFKFKVERMINEFNLVSREEFEVQKKIIAKLQKDIIQIKKKKNLEKKNLLKILTKLLKISG